MLALPGRFEGDGPQHGVPSIRLGSTCARDILATELETRAGLVTSVTAMDEKGGRHRISARQFVVACNGVDSCLLLQRSPAVPRHSSLGRYYMDHPVFDLAVHATEFDAKPDTAIARRPPCSRRFRPAGCRSASVAAWRNPVFDDGERRR
jgi:hypothetical protein